MNSQQRIILRPTRSADFEGELDGLAEALQNALPEVRVEFWDPLKRPPGSLPALGEVLTIILPFAGGYAFNKAADAIVGRLRAIVERPRGTHADDEDEAPMRLVELYGPSGEILRRIQVSDHVEDLDLDQ
jgi:hypothetical protein